jgi:long-chain acyl-CoA synthetase
LQRLKKEFCGNVTEGEIIDWAKERLAAYTYPRKVHRLNSLPRTPIGKVFRKKLREMEKKNPAE